MNRFLSPTTSAFAFGIALTIAITGLVVLLARDGDTRIVRETPAGSVERFLNAAAGGDGDTACGYLSLTETRRVERAAGRHVPCSDAFLTARLELGGKDWFNDIRRVHFSTLHNGGQVRVVAKHGTGSIEFTVAPVTVTGLEEQPYTPPSSNWRITSGATAIVRPVP